MPYIIALAVVGFIPLAAGVTVAVLLWLMFGKEDPVPPPPKRHSTRDAATQTSEVSEDVENVEDERNT